MKALQINASSGLLSDLEILEVYEFLDKPILFSAIDSEGIIYLATWYDEPEEGIEDWLYSVISPETLNRLRSGEIDFHAATLDSTYNYAFHVNENWNDKTCQISIINKKDIIPETLPDIGERLQESEVARLGDLVIPTIDDKQESIISKDFDYNGRIIKIVGIPAYFRDGSVSIGNVALALLDNFFSQIHIDFSNHELAWDDVADLGNADFEFRFSGRKTIPNRWSLKAINQSSERILSGFRILIHEERDIDDISVPYLKAGSIIYGISSRSSDVLIGDRDIEVYEALKDIRETSRWLDGSGEKPNITDARLRDVLRAIEEMSPHEKDDFSQLELLPKADSINSGVRTFNLDYKSRVSASERLQVINLKEKETRVVKFQGNIDKIRKPSKKQKLGEIHMVDLTIRPEGWTNNTVTIKFDIAKLVDSLLAFTANAAQVTVAQSYIAGRWDTRGLHLIAIKSIEDEAEDTYKVR